MQFSRMRKEDRLLSSINFQFFYNRRGPFSFSSVSLFQLSITSNSIFSYSKSKGDRLLSPIMFQFFHNRSLFLTRTFFFFSSNSMFFYFQRSKKKELLSPQLISIFPRSKRLFLTRSLFSSFLSFQSLSTISNSILSSKLNKDK